MTDAAKAQLKEVGDRLRAEPKPWKDVAAPDKNVVKVLLTAESRRGFSASQRGFIAQWWLRCTQAQVDQINALLPASTRVAARELTDESLVLSSDLLSDHEGGQTYAAARTVIESLVLIHSPEFKQVPHGWPVSN